MMGRIARVAMVGSVVLAAVGCEDESALSSEAPVFVLPAGATTDGIDFGVVAEGSFGSEAILLTNGGRVDLRVTPSLEAGSSADFAIVPEPVIVGPGASVSLSVEFVPVGPGEDAGVLVLVSDDPATPEARIPLHGGPIAPQLTVTPSPVDFAPAGASIVRRPVRLRSSGSANLHVGAVGVDPAGNPDFSIESVTIPDALAPSQELEVTIVYARSTSALEGVLIVQSDDAADDATEGARRVRLLPDPLGACGNGLDDDGDGLVDFPDDPGCEDPDDADEANPPECVHGATQPCGLDTGECRVGQRRCVAGVWGGCEGEIGVAEELCNGLDDDCDAETDEEISETCDAGSCAGARACVPNAGVPGGQWTACLPVGAVPEQCNGADDDCDGQIDEGIVEACVVNGCAGSRICVPGSATFTDCQASAPQPESCDGLDNDCDGTPDDGLDAPLSCGTGACAVTVAACLAGAPQSCTPLLPGLESCNGLDDDCDGATDELPDVTCGVGACARSVAACSNGGPGPACVEGTPAAETCNGQDDNCNGFTDEGACPICGDSAVQAPETCDDGNVLPNDGCSATCRLELCGDGVVQGAEQCDDGNVAAGDGCSPTCTTEAMACDPDGAWTFDSPVVYSCCLGTVNVNAAAVSLSLDGARATLPQAGVSPNTSGTMTGGVASCPAGSFVDSRTVAGACTEVYTVTGTFSSANSFAGEVRLEFIDDGSGQCACFGLGACTDQIFPITATRP